MDDFGDVDDYREPAPDPISAMLDEWGDDGVFVCEKPELFEAMNVACYMRECCAACALEANGEDGS